MVNWTGVLFVLCGTLLTPALCCDWLRHYGHLSNDSLTLLQQMGGQWTGQECRVPFPRKIYRDIYKAEVQSQLVFIRDSLKLISGLYHHDNLTSASWDTVKTEHFLISIHRQTEELNTCVLANKTSNSSLRKYYRRLARSTLHCTGGSPASWELIRKQTKLHLDQLDLLVECIKSSSAACRRRSAASGRQH
uniref:Interferon h n=2 Tax=Larimichthys crocea TaxID=215358 RepID=A0A1L4AIP3_LARCR|nr:interferon h [Larimichthys crocea]